MRTEFEEAIRLLRTGSHADAEHALALLQRSVVSFGIKLCGQREDAEDTAQDVLMKVLPHLENLKDARALSTWLYTAAKNRCWEGRRRSTYRKALALEDLLPDHSELQALLLSDPSPNPEQEALSREDHALLHQAVLALPSTYRIVLVLHDMEEMETELVAKILGIQPGTVRVRLHRARLLVRQEMGRLLDRRPEEPSPKSKPRCPENCLEVFGNLSEYLDGKLSPESCERMRGHIENCPACVVFIQDLKRAIDRCHSLEVCPEPQTQSTLRRLLTQEYLRLKNSSATL
jgi:RNA polymerase sigma-70 factor (ECF subfamily)